MRVLAWVITAAAILSIFVWLAFGQGWWHPLEKEDERRGAILLLFHYVALLVAPFYELIRNKP